MGSDKNQAEDLVVTLPWLPGQWLHHENWTLIAVVAAWALAQLTAFPCLAMLWSCLQPWPPGFRALHCWGSSWCLAFALILLHEAAVNPFFQTACVPPASPACSEVSGASHPSWLLFADCMSVFCLLYQVTDRDVKKAFMLWNFEY